MSLCWFYKLMLPKKTSIYNKITNSSIEQLNKTMSQHIFERPFLEKKMYIFPTFVYHMHPFIPSLICSLNIIQLSWHDEDDMISESQWKRRSPVTVFVSFSAMLGRLRLLIYSPLRAVLAFSSCSSSCRSHAHFEQAASSLILSTGPQDGLPRGPSSARQPVRCVTLLSRNLGYYLWNMSMVMKKGYEDDLTHWSLDLSRLANENRKIIPFDWQCQKSIHG